MSDVRPSSLADSRAAAGGRVRSRPFWAEAAARPEPLALRPRRPAPPASCRSSSSAVYSTPGGEDAKPLQVHAYYTWFQAGSRRRRFQPAGRRPDGHDAGDGHLHRHAHRHLFDRLHARRSGLSALLREVSLFIFSMTAAGAGRQFILLYACWEGVGLCSYLLIGFWFTKPSAAAAARKAFLVTRARRRRPVPRHPAALAKVRRPPATTRASSSDLPRTDPYYVDAGVSACCSAGRWASRRSSRCTSGCPTRWKARRRSAP